MNSQTLIFCGSLEGFKAQDLPNYHPQVFPPKDDFCVTVEKDGTPKSRYSDDCWDLTGYEAGSRIQSINFQKHQLSPVNDDLLRQATFLFFYHMPIFPKSVAFVYYRFAGLAHLARFLDSKKIRLDQLYRYPRTYRDLADVIPQSIFKDLITSLKILLSVEDVLRWKIADDKYIENLAKTKKPHTPIQSAYIPPRLWVSLIQTAEAVMDDFESHQDAFVDAWQWISDAYRRNIENGYSELSPFRKESSKRATGTLKVSYQNDPQEFFEEHGILHLLDKWIGYTDKCKIRVEVLKSISMYACLVRDCAYTFLLAHSIQRQAEGSSLRSDCFLIDDDPSFGKVAMLVGETTKTDPDSDARWAVPMRVQKAVDIMSFIARLRLDSICIEAYSESDQQIILDISKNPFLRTGQVEYWSPISRKSPLTNLRVRDFSLKDIVKRNPYAFNPDDYIISQEDYNIAYHLTPELTKTEWFKAGGTWSFSPHQLRRTLAVNMYAHDVPESVLQWQMKHGWVFQTKYYGRNSTQLDVNNTASKFAHQERNRSVVRAVIDAVENSTGDHVLPTGNVPFSSEVLNLVEQRDHKKLESAAQQGTIHIRKTLLGLCMSSTCKYGGWESAIHCAGLDGKAPCKDSVFKKSNTTKLSALHKKNADEISSLEKGTPLHSKLENENKAIEVYFDVTTQKR